MAAAAAAAAGGAAPAAPPDPRGAGGVLLKDEYGVMDASGQTYVAENFITEHGYVIFRELPSLFLASPDMTWMQ